MPNKLQKKLCTPFLRINSDFSEKFPSLRSKMTGMSFFLNINFVHVSEDFLFVGASTHIDMTVFDVRSTAQKVVILHHVLWFKQCLLRFRKSTNVAVSTQSSGNEKRYKNHSTSVFADRLVVCAKQDQKMLDGNTL